METTHYRMNYDADGCSSKQETITDLSPVLLHIKHSIASLLQLMVTFDSGYWWFIAISVLSTHWLACHPRCHYFLFIYSFAPLFAIHFPRRATPLLTWSLFSVSLKWIHLMANRKQINTINNTTSSTHCAHYTLLYYIIIYYWYYLKRILSITDTNSCLRRGHKLWMANTNVLAKGEFDAS